MISAPDRQIAVELIDEARTAGARLKPACKVLNMSDRTYQRWTKEGAVVIDHKGFCSLDEAREWVAKFVRWYNTEHLHSGIKFITPYQRHYSLDEAIMDNVLKHMN